MADNPDIYNPIENVDGAFIRSPSVFNPSYQDISDPDAGRTEDGEMHKMQIGTKVKIALAWNNITQAEASTILSAFSNEYMSIKYKDPLTNSFVTKTFYAGDRNITTYSSRLGIMSSVSVNIIER